jgi:hypothetical protein
MIYPERAEALTARIRKSKNKQVSSTALREEVQLFVREYFSQTKPIFPANRCVALIESLDTCFQDLMRCTHARTLKSRYLNLLKEIARIGREVELALLIPISVKSARIMIGGDKEQLIITTLQQLVPTAASSFEQGLRDLASGERASWRGTAVEFRESLREVLDHLAPDQDVIAQAGFTQEKGTNGPTMRQKTMFILKSRKARSAEAKACVDAVSVVDELVGNFVRSVYTRSSVVTHGTAGKDEANRVREYVTLTLLEILSINNYAG